MNGNSSSSSSSQRRLAPKTGLSPPEPPENTAKVSKSVKACERCRGMRKRVPSHTSLPPFSPTHYGVSLGYGLTFLSAMALSPARGVGGCRASASILPSTGGRGRTGGRGLKRWSSGTRTWSRLSNRWVAIGMRMGLGLSQ